MGSILPMVGAKVVTLWTFVLSELDFLFHCFIQVLTLLLLFISFLRFLFPFNSFTAGNEFGFVMICGDIPIIIKLLPPCIGQGAFQDLLEFLLGKLGILISTREKWKTVVHPAQGS